MNTNQPMKLILSAIAPEINATVIIANISWNIEYAFSGIVGAL